jgi:hypothetical protein
MYLSRFAVKQYAKSQLSSSSPAWTFLAIGEPTPRDEGIEVAMVQSPKLSLLRGALRVLTKDAQSETLFSPQLIRKFRVISGICGVTESHGGQGGPCTADDLLSPAPNPIHRASRDASFPAARGARH